MIVPINIKSYVSPLVLKLILKDIAKENLFFFVPEGHM
jgi:hypothetical protein